VTEKEDTKACKRKQINTINGSSVRDFMSCRHISSRYPLTKTISQIERSNRPAVSTLTWV